MDCDLLVFAPHPDDAEIHCCCAIARTTRAGRRVVVVDATRGEMGSRGTAAGRAAEAEAAAAILGLAGRRNLALPDGGLDARDPAARLAVVEVIRALRPRLIAVNHPHARHPDHRALADLVLSCAKAAELHRWPGCPLPAWRGARLCCYEAELAVTPQVLVGAEEDDWQRTLAAIRCYGSQLHRTEAGEPETSIAQPGFLGWIEARARAWGQQAGSPVATALCAGLEILAADDLAVFSPRS